MGELAMMSFISTSMGCWVCKTKKAVLFRGIFLRAVCYSDTQGLLGSPWPLCLKRGWGKNVLYAPLAVERLVAAVCVFRPYAAKPNRSERVSRRGPMWDTWGARSRAGLDAGASGDYRAWPFKDGKQQRPAAGQGSGPRAI